MVRSLPLTLKDVQGEKLHPVQSWKFRIVSTGQ
jgi:hypothetical protein